MTADFPERGRYRTSDTFSELIKRDPYRNWKTPARDRRRDGPDAIDRLMRQPGTLAAIPPPRPLHRMGKRDDNDETAIGERP